MLVMDNIIDLIQLLRDGDKSVEDEIINFYIPLARKLTQRFVRRFPERRSDLRQVAMLELVVAVREAASKLYDNNIEPYINVRVVGAIKRYLSADHMIHVPRETWRRMILALELNKLDDEERHRVLSTLKTGWLVFQASSQEDGEYLPDFVFLSRQISRIYAAPLNAKEIKKLLNLTAYERILIQLRLENYTTTEIGTLMECQQSTVMKDLVSIQERYIRLQNRHPNLPEPPE